MKIFSTSLVFFTFASFFTSANTVYGDVLLTEIQPKAGELWSQTNKFHPTHI